MRISFLLLFFLFLLSCGDGKITEIEITDNQFYKNHHDSVKYVGKETCKTCHVDIYNSYIETRLSHPRVKKNQSYNSSCFIKKNY